MSLYLSHGGARLRSGFELGELVYPATAVFVLFEMMVLVWLHRPIVWRRSDGSTTSRNVVLQDVLFGLALGLGGFVIGIPFLSNTETELFVAAIIRENSPLQPRDALNVLLLVLALPLGIELFFRGTTQRILGCHVRPLAAILVSGMLSAQLWHPFNPAFALILGLASATSYDRRRSVVASIVTNSMMTVAAIIYIGWPL